MSKWFGLGNGSSSSTSSSSSSSSSRKHLLDHDDARGPLKYSDANPAELPIAEITFEIHLIPNFGGVREIYGQILRPYLQKKLVNTHLAPNGRTRWDFTEGKTKIIASISDSYLGVISPSTIITLRSRYPEHLRIVEKTPPDLNIESLIILNDRDALLSHYPSFPMSSSTHYAIPTPQPFETEMQPQVPRLNVNFSELGIGGMDSQLNEIMVELLSRCVKESTRKKLDLQEHTKGIILYGPPGTGKTLIASKIAAILNVPKERFKAVNGPEVLSKYIGEGEKNTRELFSAAQSDPRNLYVLFFDEFDAIARARGGEGTGARVGDNIVNTILSKMDGAEKINNILVIAATNRLDIIDDALLRSGRFGTKLCIGLPDLQGRRDIFDIHTRKIAASVMEGVDLNTLAELTKNYTGSEIKAVCHTARLMGLQSAAIDPKDISSIDESKIKITMAHFLASIDKVKPHLGKHINKSDILPVRSAVIPSQQDILSVIGKRIQSFRPGRISTVLITGEPGSGKSSIAGLVMDQFKTHFDSVQVVTASISGRPIVDELTRAWEDSKPVQKTLLILDGLERLIELVNEHRFNENAVKKLNSLFGAETFKPSQSFVVIATMNTSAEIFYKLLNPLALWSARFLVEPMRATDVGVLMEAQKIQCPDLAANLEGKPIAKVLDILFSGKSSYDHDEWLEHIDLFTLDDIM